MPTPEDPDRSKKKPKLRVIDGTAEPPPTDEWSKFVQRARRKGPPLLKAAVMGSRRPDVAGTGLGKLFYPIQEVSELVDVQPHVLRYWESEFPMLAPQKNKAGQRVYRREDVEIVARIRELLHDEKLTIDGARRKLEDELGRSGPDSV